MDPRERFTDAVADYERWRPDYPAALLDWLRAAAPGLRAVELGSGTGIFSRQLASAGFTVTGIEPNAAMRASAERHHGAPRTLPGEAEATGLPDRSADLVVAAQAFHWFDLDRALPEIDRILVPDGLAAAIWNTRVDEGFGHAYEAILRTCSSSYAEVAKPGPTLERLRAARPDGQGLSFPHGQSLDLDGVLGRAWSSSYVVHGVSDREAFDAKLREAFREHAALGRVVLRYETVAWVWRERRASYP